MGDTCAAGFDEGTFFGREVDCVGEDGPGREEVVGVVDGGVGGVGGEELADEGELGEVLGEVRLNGEVGFFVQGS